MLVYVCVCVYVHNILYECTTYHNTIMYMCIIYCVVLVAVPN